MGFRGSRVQIPPSRLTCLRAGSSICQDFAVGIRFGSCLRSDPAVPISAAFGGRCRFCRDSDFGVHSASCLRSQRRLRS